MKFSFIALVALLFPWVASAQFVQAGTYQGKLVMQSTPHPGLVPLAFVTTFSIGKPNKAGSASFRAGGLGAIFRPRQGAMYGVLYPPNIFATLENGATCQSIQAVYVYPGRSTKVDLFLYLDCGKTGPPPGWTSYTGYVRRR